ncbi:MAG: DUF2894 domain-containing protein [Leptothrix sp. (in: Bacteria)]|nr:DUF2894 domain-containing protein [Leptothrix sp. (in: b-proteobacteria)]
MAKGARATGASRWRPCHAPAMAPHRNVPEPSADGAPSLDTLRLAHAQAAAPVQVAYLQAMGRRASAHQGEVRRALDQKVAQAQAALVARLAATPRPVGAAVVASDADGTATQPGPLGALLQYIDTLDRPRAGPGASAPATTTAGPAIAAAAATATAAATAPRKELKALAANRLAWTRLAAARELKRSLACVPDNPGPLNSQHLLLRALQLMQDSAPAYLDHFMCYADTLLWLDQAALADIAEPARPTTRSGSRRPAGARGKPA